MKISYSLVFTLLYRVALCQHDTGPKYILNGQGVDLKILELINPKNIDKIDVIKTTNPPEIRITTKKEIEYLSYKELKIKAKVEQSENPPVIVDFKRIENEKTMMIDKNLIRKINVNKGTIEIRTPWYQKRKKEQGKPKIVIR